jgi:hypothetical protein
MKKPRRAQGLGRVPGRGWLNDRHKKTRSGRALSVMYCAYAYISQNVKFTEIALLLQALFNGFAYLRFCVENIDGHV